MLKVLLICKCQIMPICNGPLLPFLNRPIATQVQGKERKRQPPLPLSTLEMQKKATQSLHMPGERIMKVAEELYQSGFISYPRTETDSFPPGMDLMVSQLCMSSAG